MKPCVGYIRVSTQKQGEGVSLEAQKDAITAFASRNDLTVTKWFEEKETAAKSGRPVFTGMLKKLKQGKAQGVIIHKIDRSARNLRDWAMFSELPDAGVSVYVATESLDFNSRGGRLTADIQAVVAAQRPGHWCAKPLSYTPLGSIHTRHCWMNWSGAACETFGVAN